MTRSYTIEQEEIDIDVCYGDYDGSIRRTIDVVNYYEDDVRLFREQCFEISEEGTHDRNVAINKFMDGVDDLEDPFED